MCVVDPYFRRTGAESTASTATQNEPFWSSYVVFFCLCLVVVGPVFVGVETSPKP